MGAGGPAAGRTLLLCRRVGAPTPPDDTWSWRMLVCHGARPVGFYGRLLLQLTRPAGSARLRLRLHEAAGAGYIAETSVLFPSGAAYHDALDAVAPAVLAAALHAWRPSGISLMSGTALDMTTAWRALLAEVVPRP